ncbi:presqualene diphosphate synthase HpnD [Magnetovibrio sp. PR-2]|uniref:presqualene diphosphate synthase HpnD n=1 Tax=Magnetovibrio sp. PR-2 TaxID=3120356 RepID=UPI002FCE61F7
MNQTAAPACDHPTAGKAVNSSFYWAMRLMPKAQREAMFVVYGFCREVDDIADGFDASNTKMQRLEDWRHTVERLYTDAQPRAELSCLHQVVHAYGLNKADLMAVIDGMEMDAHARVRIADEAQFDLYIDRVASAVGRLSDKVFGVEGPEADRLAHHLGRGLQITNILRDLGEDAERGRLYLPLTMLNAAGIASDNPQDVFADPHVQTVLDQLAAQARDHFSQARAALAHLDKAKTRPARVMMAVYERVLDRLQARGLSNIATPVKLPKWQKLWLALYHGLL